MNAAEIKRLLEEVRTGEMSVETAFNSLQSFPYTDLGFAKIDHHRETRTGTPEIVYCAGKTVEQVKSIFELMATKENMCIGTRATRDMFEAVQLSLPKAEYWEMAKIIALKNKMPEPPSSEIAVVTAGTSDMAVAEEAAVTVELLGNRVVRIYDVGVAGLHRLLDKIELIRKCKVVIVIAGMEGALASVVGGLIDKPIIAVPTSIGYGANFAGLSALLSMMSSCAAGIAVVNIDNGFGAGFYANRLNRL